MEAKIGQTLSIGLRPEHNARKYEFDVAKWRRIWPDATAINVIVQRPGDKTAYPAISTADGDKVTWTVTRYDTERPGVGAMWVAFTNGDKLLGLTLPETAIIVQEGPDMVSGDTPASDTPPWIQQVLDAIANFTPGEGGGGTPGKDGEDGATFYPDVSADGVISWTNDKGLENPKPVDITGPEGKPGEKGDPGSTLTQYLHNADFTQFVAQAGIGETHAGSAAKFGGDRWKLTGMLTAEANVNGNGYSKVTLNGTLEQKVEMPPANGYAGVSTLSGNAEISYADGVVTITGDGCVLDQAWLCDKESEMPPARRGYSAELMECYRYYICFAKTDKLSYAGFAQSETEARFTIPLPVPMRLGSPTQRIQFRSTMQMYPGAVTPEAINSVTVIGNTASLSLKSSGLTKGAVMALKTNALIELSADL